jgi:hypothetical protein
MMIHTTYATLIEKSGQWLGLNTFLHKLEKVTGPRDTYGLSTPIALGDILRTQGVIETIEILGKVTDGETAKAIDLCKKIVRVAVHKSCDLIGKKAGEFDWYKDFPDDDAGHRLAAFWANDASSILSSLNSHQDETTPVSYFTTLAHNAVAILLKTATALNSLYGPIELEFMNDHIKMALYDDLTPTSGGTDPELSSSPPSPSSDPVPAASV